MDSVTITRPVIIKVRATEGFKQALIGQLEASVQSVEREIERLDFEIKRARAGGPRLAQVEARLQDERARRVDLRHSLLEQVRMAKELKEGDEVVRGRAESLVEVRVGDEYLFTATVGRGGEVQVSRGSAIAEELEDAIDRKQRITVVPARG